MTRPRHQTVYSDRPGMYHCVTRCVRQAFLCDDYPVLGTMGIQRRAWIEARMLELAESFAVGLYAWAAMGNHCHLVLLVDPQRPLAWSDSEVARRWSRISQFPGRPVPKERQERRARQILSDPRRLEEIRNRLGSLSWFMRFLNEGIARRANAEDGCKGRFWDGRFKAQNLLDDRAALAAMVYVDLNPIRAGLAQSMRDSDFTSIQLRLLRLERGHEQPHAPLEPLAGCAREQAPGLTLASYLELVDWTGRQQHPEKRGRIPAATPSALSGIGGKPDRWALLAQSVESEFARFVGTTQALSNEAANRGNKWLRGMRFTRSLDEPEP